MRPKPNRAEQRVAEQSPLFDSYHRTLALSIRFERSYRIVAYRIVSSPARRRWTSASSATRSSNRLLRSHLRAALRLLNPTTSCSPTRAFTNDHSGRQRAGPDFCPARPAASHRTAAADILASSHRSRSRAQGIYSPRHRGQDIRSRARQTLGRWNNEWRAPGHFRASTECSQLST